MSHETKELKSNLTRCPFYPYCKFEGLDNHEIVKHITKKHTVCRSNYYPDSYRGNGSNNTIEVSND